MNSKTFRVGLLTFLAFALVFASGASAAEPLRVATGGPNGTYCAFAKEIAAAAKGQGLDIEVLNTAGSMENIKLLKTGKADVAFVQSDVLGFLLQTEKNAAREFKVIFPLYNEEVQILANNKIQSISDFKGKRIVTGSQRSGSWLTVSNIIFQLAIPTVNKITDMDPDDAVIAVLTGRADAMVYVGGRPTPLFTKLEKMAQDPKQCKLLQKVHMLPVDDSKLLSAYYTQSTLGPSDYSWMSSQIPTLAVKAYMIRFDPQYNASEVRANPKDQQISQLIKVVRDNIETWKKSGHDKWKQVDIDAKLLAPWEREPLLMNDVQVEDLKDIFK
ncbi:MAG: TAXI family TRAP transporter solute-binding subunit [Thermodesulfobacteriota bacterium]